MADSKSMYLYEGMFLLESNNYASNAEGVVSEVTELLEKSGAEIIVHRPWTEGRLAYEIEGQRKGLHYIVMFKMPGVGVTKVTRSVQLNAHILRHLVIRHPQNLFDALVAALTGEDKKEEETPAKTEATSETPKEAKEAKEAAAEV